MSEFYQFSANALSGESVSMADFKDKVVLIVNTASECGFTGQFEGLEGLYQQYADKGLVVLGFPCNQFGQQEPGSSSEISGFCQKNYGVTFPMFEKIDVNGSHAHPLYQYLSKEKKGLLGSKKIKWNFTKFLINKQGEVVDRFAPTTKPEQLNSKIESLLE